MTILKRFSSHLNYSDIAIQSSFELIEYYSAYSSCYVFLFIGIATAYRGSLIDLLYRFIYMA